MDALYGAYLEQGFVDWLFAFAGLVGFGFLLGMSVWLLSYLVGMIVGFFKL